MDNAKKIKVLMHEKNRTKNIRKIKNELATVYVEENMLDEAVSILDHSCPYSVIDDDDVITLKILSELYLKKNDRLLSDLYANSFYYFTHDAEKNREYTDEILNKNDTCYERFLKNEYDSTLLKKIIIENVILLRTIEAALYYRLFVEEFGEDEYFETLFKNRFAQANDFLNRIQKQPLKIIIVDFEYSHLRCVALQKCLKQLGFDAQLLIDDRKSNIFKDKALICEVENISENRVFDALKNIHIGNTTDEPIIILGETNVLKQFVSIDQIYRIVEVFYRHYEEQPNAHLDCILLGDFYQTSSYMYEVNTKLLVERKPKYKYSVVIPARNSGKYFEYALKACLNIKYKFEYEVLVSDNSDNGNDEIFEIVKKYKSNHPNLNYIRTPLFIPLANNFEYAYLSAQGEKIVTIGSDDAVVDTIFDYLDYVYSKYPDNIIHFHGFSYNWPDTKSSMSWLILNELQLPNNKDVCEISLCDVREDFITGRYPFQYLPIMYMNTCVAREHIKKIINVTGKFEYGESQDVYTGILNTLMEEKVTYCRFPLLIGGGSSIGFGAIANASSSGEDTKKLFLTRNTTRRFTNYYTPDYWNTMTNSIPTENEQRLQYSEFYKISRLDMLRRKKYLTYPKDDALRMLKSCYRDYPLSSKDINILRVQARKLASSFGNEVYTRFMEIENELLDERSNLTSGLNIKSRIKLFLNDTEYLYKVVMAIAVLLSTDIHKRKSNELITYSKNEVSIKKYKNPSLKYNCDKHNIKNVEEAAKYASEWLRVHYLLGE